MLSPRASEAPTGPKITNVSNGNGHTNGSNGGFDFIRIGEPLVIVFSDTPGILEPHYLLHEKMMDFVHSSIADSDIVLFITDLEEAYFDKTLTSVLEMVKTPIVVVLNKTDLSTANEINKLVSGNTMDLRVSK